MYGNNIISGAVVPSSNAIGLHFYPSFAFWMSASTMVVLTNSLYPTSSSVSCYMGRGKLSPSWYALDLCRYSCCFGQSAVFLVYPFGQGSFSDGFHILPLITPLPAEHSILCTSSTCLESQVSSVVPCSPHAWFSGYLFSGS